jgi:hypothetical protein
MGLLKPLFAAEAKLQGAALGQVAGYTLEEAVAEIEEAKKANKASRTSIHDLLSSNSCKSNDEAN